MCLAYETGLMEGVESESSSQRQRPLPPGNRTGARRPPNARPKLITALREALDEDETLERLKAVAIAKMEDGDPAFWRMLLDRVWPAKLELGGIEGGPLTFEHIVRAARAPE